MFRPALSPRHNQPLVAKAVRLTLEQGPLQGVVALEHKEKARRALDPPSIIRLDVDAAYDHEGIFLVNPFLLMVAHAVGEHPDEEGKYTPIQPSPLIGSYSSSLYRLKDPQNKDSAFFVFGDISCKITGPMRLQFSLFEIRFDQQRNSYINFVSSIMSTPFRVVGTKEFRGLMESTHLSRTFSEQGVRMRLRKETRSTGKKRSFPIDTPTAEHTPFDNAAQLEQTQQRVFAQPVKRRRGDSSDAATYSTQQQMIGGPIASYDASAEWTGYDSQTTAYTPHSQAAYGQNQYAPHNEYAMRAGSTIEPSAQDILRWERTWGAERAYATGPYPALQTYGAVGSAQTQALQAQSQASTHLTATQTPQPQAAYSGINVNEDIQSLMGNQDLSAWEFPETQQHGGV